MRAAAASRKMTAMEFLRAYEGVEGRWELVDGVPMMMTGGTRRHAEVAANILTALRARLSGTGCSAFGSDFGVLTGVTKVRYPDVSVYCDRRDLDSDPNQQLCGRYPSVLFEVLSPSTRFADYGEKLSEYQSLESLSAVVLVDVEQDLIEVMHRTSGGQWIRSALAQEAALALDTLGIEMPQAEIFLRI